MKLYLISLFALLSNFAFSQSNQWAYVDGTLAAPLFGVYGSKGVKSFQNHPGGRQSSFYWTDTSGNHWLFGGQGYSGDNSGYLNDLWRYSPEDSVWTWISGIKVADAKGYYGAKGVSTAQSGPGAREGGASWGDRSGNLWLFGGYGYGNAGYLGYMNDLWKFDPASLQWTWISGDTTPSQQAVYGTIGVSATANKPGARKGSAGWCDRNGDVWIFGGEAYTGLYTGVTSDLWKFSVSIGQWTWMKGRQTFDDPGIFGTKGVPASANVPGARRHPISVSDSAGNLWLAFGGTTGGSTTRNDVWKFSPESNLWTWISGDNITGQNGNYGTAGVAGTANKPGARETAAGWIDMKGDIWLYGGKGRGAFSSGYLNDLWKYSPGAGQWTWVAGTNSSYTSGVYGEKGKPEAGNRPGGRLSPMGWSEKSGDIIILGGEADNTDINTRTFNDQWTYHTASGLWSWDRGDNRIAIYGKYTNIPDSTAFPGGRTQTSAWFDNDGNFWLTCGIGNTEYGFGHLSDVWKFNVANSRWTLMKGNGVIGNNAVLGRKSVGGGLTNPPGKTTSMRWRDPSGDLWIFGGRNVNMNGGVGNDLWKFSVSKNEWAWYGGDLAAPILGVFGTKGVSLPENIPGGRQEGVTWMDKSGNLWLFGGELWPGTLNDLWKYMPSTGQWTWMSGDNTTNSLGIYGTKGVASNANKPGARSGSVAWTDPEGNFWMYGGSGYNEQYNTGLADMWKYTVSTGQWTWMAGSKTDVYYPSYGTLGVPSPANHPGYRYYAAGWVDKSGNFYLFGGQGSGENAGSGMLNDLWKFNPVTNEWTWLGGSKMLNQSGIAGPKMSFSPNNTPGSRYVSAVATDPSGRAWIFGGLAYSIGGTGFLNDLWVYANPVSDLILPLEFLSVTADRQQNSVAIKWSTTKEKGVSSFEVERSADGKNFTSIGKLLARNSPLGVNVYSFDDNAASPDISYYRIGEIDHDGKSLYSRIVKVAGISIRNAEFSIVENPLRENLKLRMSVPEAGKVHYEIRNSSGIRLVREEKSLTNGVSDLIISVSTLKSGIYTISVYFKNSIATKSFVKK